MSDPHEAMARAERAGEVNADQRPVSIDGEVVTRPAPENATAVHDFLRHLRARGIGVPEPLDLAGGVERLRFLVGESGGDGWYHQHDDRGLASAARLLRQVHDAGRDWPPPVDTRWPGPGSDTSADGDLVLCHGDPGPWNFVWQDRQAVGLVDWDLMHPGRRFDDVAYALHWFVPLRADEFVLQWHHFPEVPDRRHRVQVFLEAYGDLPDVDVADAVIRRMQATSDLVRSLADQGVEPQATWVAEGSLEDAAAEMAWVEENRSLFS